MQNVKMKLSKDGKKLSIDIDLTENNGPSASGKTVRVASTLGNKPIEGTEAFIGLNVYKYANPK